MLRHHSCLGWLALIFMLMLHTTPAQLHQPAAGDTGTWTAVGPAGSYTNFLVIDPQTPTTLYAGVESTLYRTDNGGATWSALDLKISPPPPLSTIAIDPQTPTTLYAATYTEGIFRSRDRGESWQVARPGFGFIMHLAVDPHHSGIVYAGGEGTIGWSRDYGITWEPLASVPPFSTLALDPHHSGVMYIGTEVGLYHSIDGGVTWQPVTTGLPTDPVYTLAFDPQDSELLYAGTQAGLYHSRDGGASWHILTSSLSFGPYTTLAIDPQHPTTLYAVAEDSLYRSEDGGASWHDLSSMLPLHVGVFSLAIDPQAPANLYAGTKGWGVWHSGDGGATWESSNAGIRAGSIMALAGDPQHPAIYAALYGGIARTTDGGGMWQMVSLESHFHSLIINPLHPTTLYAASYSEGVFRSTDSGTTWAAVNAGLPFTQTGSLIIDPQTSDTLFVSTSLQGIYRSRDGGDHWSRSESPSCSGKLAISSQQPTTIYGGFELMIFCRSIDGGETWQMFRTNLSSPWQYGPITQLIVHPQQPAEIYAATAAGGVFRSTDGGETWITINNGLTDLHVFALIMSPQHPMTFYASTPTGIFRIRDGETDWARVLQHPREPREDAQGFHLLLDPLTPTRLYSAAAGIGLSVIDLADARPTAITNAAYQVRNTSATLIGTVGAVNAAVQFQLTTTGGDYRTATIVPAGYVTVDNPLASARVVGLRPDTTYFYRVAAANSAGPASGNEQQFTTSATPPTLHAGNGLTGAPGSVFLIQATALAPMSRLVIMVNGHVVGTITTTADGQGAFALAFPNNIAPGMYLVSVAEHQSGIVPGSLMSPAAELQLTIDPAAPRLVVSGGAPVIPALPTIYLPIIER